MNDVTPVLADQHLVPFDGPFVDSHAHLDFDAFKGRHHDVLKKAHQAGVKTIVSIGTTLKSWDPILTIAEKHPPVYATVGIHPCDAKDVAAKGLKELLLEKAKHPKVVGFGETGLDFFHKPFDATHQEAMLWQHIEAGHKADLPLVIHSRAAEEATLSVLKEAALQGTRCVMHCFSGTKAFASACLDLGFYLSFSGILTFKNAKELQDIAQFAPLDRVLVETDAPYLAPHPLRGKTNEPAFVQHTARKLADLKSLSLQAIATQTTQNFYRLFSKAAP
ncbi:MAG: TatD family hydrolase [Holosporaceae bacterium]